MHLSYLEIAQEHGQNINERIPFKDQTWKGTKTRTRDATLSRLVWLKSHFLLSSTRANGASRISSTCYEFNPKFNRFDEVYRVCLDNACKLFTGTQVLIWHL